MEYIRKLDASGKARPCILDNVERSLLCHTCYLGFDQFECTDCDNWNIIPHSCHSRFCNACGVKYAKQLAAKATYPHRHIVFTIPEELRNWFRQDRTRLDLLFVAARNTICICDILLYSHMFTLNSHLDCILFNLEWFHSILKLWTPLIIQTFQLKHYLF